MYFETLRPNGNGDTNQWTNSGGNQTNNYTFVNSTATSPVTTSYVQDVTSGDQDLYAMTDLIHTTGTVVGVCHVAYSAKNDANSRSIMCLNKRASVTQGPQVPLTTTFVAAHGCFNNDPETSAPWTIANVNAVQSGVQVV